MALSAPKPTKTLDVGPLKWNTFKVAALAIIYPGAIVAIDADGYLVPGDEATTLKTMGIATPKEHQLYLGGGSKGYIDATDAADGDFECEVLHCIAYCKNSAGDDEVEIAHVGDDCYLVDDETVALTDGSTAGTAQVTRGDVAFNGTDAVGLDVDALPTISVASNTSDDQTAADLRDAWNASAQHYAVAVASIDTSGAESYIILTFQDGGAAAHTVTAYSPATADVTGITNTTARVAPVAATRSVAGKVWQVDANGVWVDMRRS